MRISAVIATKGRPERLRATLESISRCEPPPAEVILVDGDPAGSARAVAESFAAPDAPARPPVRWVPSEPGLTLQRNRALELVGGEVVAFVDDDVDFNPDVFRLLGDAYRDPSVVGATGRVVEEQGRRFGNSRSAIRRFVPGGGEEGRMTRFGYPRRIQTPEGARDVEYMLGSLMTARTQAAQRVRFDERLPGYGLAEDEDFSYRLSRLGRIRYVPEAIVRHEGTGARASASRAFNRSVVVNRAYLFRKNFRRTRLARLQFGMLVAILIAHRAVNREWDGVRGLVEGSVEAWLSGRARRVAERPPEGTTRRSPPAPVPVTFVASHAGHGGSERYLEVLVSTLGSDWVERVIALEDGPLVGRLRELGVEVTLIQARGKRGIVSGVVALRRALRGHEVRVVHANGVKAALVTALATLGAETPLVWVKHDFSWDGPLARALGRRSRRVVAVSSAVTATFRAPMAARVHVVPVGIPLPEIDRRAARARIAQLLACAEDVPIVTLVGRLQASKGQLELLEVVPEILEREPRARFCFVGEDHPFQPDYAQALRARCEALGLGRSVTFAGHRADAVWLIAGSDVIVLPSMPDRRGRGREGLSLVAIEALAVGTPVVNYAHGGLPEAVGEAGRLVDVGDRAGLRDGILDVLANDATRAEMVARGRERVMRLNQPAMMAAAMKERYREAAAG